MKNVTTYMYGTTPDLLGNAKPIINLTFNFYHPNNIAALLKKKTQNGAFFQLHLTSWFIHAISYLDTMMTM
jgi:hypothetical protein